MLLHDTLWARGLTAEEASACMRIAERQRSGAMRLGIIAMAAAGKRDEILEYALRNAGHPTRGSALADRELIAATQASESADVAPYNDVCPTCHQSYDWEVIGGMRLRRTVNSVSVYSARCGCGISHVKAR